jgi:hypothetical protein
MTHVTPAATTTPVTRPPMPSITASALLESRLLVRSVAAWLAASLAS